MTYNSHVLPLQNPLHERLISPDFLNIICILHGSHTDIVRIVRRII